MTERLLKQIEFLKTADKLKEIQRRNFVISSNRSENSAEHSWHLSLYASILKEYLPEIDLSRVLQMVAIHDLVEIEADDTFIYDEINMESKMERELLAAENIFGILPEDQKVMFLNLWMEFEECITSDAVAANVIDKFQVLIQNFNTDGGTWSKYGISRFQIEDKKELIKDISPALWGVVELMLDTAEKKGWLSQPHMK